MIYINLDARFVTPPPAIPKRVQTFWLWTAIQNRYKTNLCSEHNRKQSRNKFSTEQNLRSDI